MMSEKAIEIGQRVQLIRKRESLSQEQFAEQFSLSQNQISRIESGHCMVTTDFVLKLNELYGVDPSYLLLGKSSRGLDPEMERFLSWYEKLDDPDAKSKASKVWDTIIAFTGK
ncbi:MAG: helix-turn-helix transcriptional regulator [Firmicutes bacterium]|nr:helix-turn-helix transcriptional regulator [Bacillota bacterium]